MMIYRSFFACRNNSSLRWWQLPKKSMLFWRRWLLSRRNSEHTDCHWPAILLSVSVSAFVRFVRFYFPRCVLSTVDSCVDRPLSSQLPVCFSWYFQLVQWRFVRLRYLAVFDQSSVYRTFIASRYVQQYVQLCSLQAFVTVPVSFAARFIFAHCRSLAIITFAGQLLYLLLYTHTNTLTRNTRLLYCCSAVYYLVHTRILTSSYTRNCSSIHLSFIYIYCNNSWSVNLFRIGCTLHVA